MYSVLVLHSSQSHSTFSFLSEAAVTCFLMLCNGCFPFCLSSHYAFYSFYALVHPEDQHHSPLLKLSNSKLKTISCPFNISTYTFHTCSAFSILQIWRQQGLENRHVTVSSWPSFSPQGKSRSSRFLSSCPPWGGEEEGGSSRRWRHSQCFCKMSCFVYHTLLLHQKQEKAGAWLYSELMACNFSGFFTLSPHPPQLPYAYSVPVYPAFKTFWGREQHLIA